MTVRNKKLNARLSAIAGFVDDGESVADIGADHGYLPVHLVREGISPFAILTDLNPGPLEKTRAMIQKSCMDNQKSFIDNRKLELRLGDGLTALGDGEVDTVVIAGMGGETIISILAKDPAKAMSFRKYVLQSGPIRLSRRISPGDGFEALYA